MKYLVCLMYMIVGGSWMLAQAPGSGSALDFNAASDYVSIPHNAALNTTNALTLEAWIKADSWNINSWGNVIISKDGWGSGEGGYTLRCGANGTLSFNIGTTTSWKEVVSTPQMALNTWYHVAGTFDGTRLYIYINGVLSGTTNYVGTILTTTYDLVIGRITYTAGGTRNFDGKIDEVRVWSAALPAVTIQEYMTKKVTASHPNYANLMGYWKLDEGTGTTTADSGPGGFTGTRLGTTWGLSGAAIGDSNAFAYGTPVNVTLTNVDGSSFLAHVNSGNPTGVHVYAVDQVPNTIAENLTGSLETTRYYGTFIVGGTNPNYSVTYDYTGVTPLATSPNEHQIRLAYRADNTGVLWSRTTNQFHVDTTGNLVSKCGLTTRREFAAGFDSLRYAISNSTICQGDTLLYFGQPLTTAGLYTHASTQSNGCDSTVGVQLSVTPSVFGNDSATICSGDSVVFGGQVLDSSGTYTGILAAASGCDSVVTFSLTVTPPLSTSIADTICEDDSYTLGTQTLTQAGVYSETFAAVNGCDSVVVLSLSIHTIDTLVLVVGTTLVADLFSPTYQWLNCDNGFAPIPGQTNQSFTPSTNGSYAVIVSDGICSDTSGCHFVLAVGMGAGSLTGIEVYPNPAQDVLFVRQRDGGSLGRVEVIGVDGRAVQRWDSMEAELLLDLKGLARGAYCLRVNGKAKLFVIER